jgi:predicted Zn-dependent protease
MVSLIGSLFASSVFTLYIGRESVKPTTGRRPAELERALSLNPNSDLIVVQQGEVLTWLGRPEEGIEWVRRAMRLNPYHPERFWSHLGRAQYSARVYADAIASGASAGRGSSKI